MAIWNKKDDHIENALHGKELKALLKERQLAGGPEVPWRPETSWYRERIIDENDDSSVSIYRVGFFITAVLTFLGCWIYAIASWGFLLGVGLGWIPSFFIAIIAGFIWPLFALILVLGVIALLILGWPELYGWLSKSLL